ncbi:hypothetical protein AVEN_57769-1 [Araneus ventricosus]|uniref:Uncharacterized protein n=1 Tax=Araneus ventricosus TaxID=182803 RepID=A0A4Y2NA05_ARAVE|nr:hypothetical protein AVEN_57769-1 [Araneus ventricosus]
MERRINERFINPSLCDNISKVLSSYKRMIRRSDYSEKKDRKKYVDALFNDVDLANDSPASGCNDTDYNGSDDIQILIIDLFWPQTTQDYPSEVLKTRSFMASECLDTNETGLSLPPQRTPTLSLPFNYAHNPLPASSPYL